MFKQIKMLINILQDAAFTYRMHLRFKHLKYLDEIDEKINDLADDGAPSAQYRIKQLRATRKRHLEEFEQFGALRSPSDSSDKGKDV